MKKILAFAVAAIATFAMTSCGNKAKENKENTESNKFETTAARHEVDKEEENFEDPYQLDLRTTQDSLAHFMGISLAQEFQMQQNMIADKIDMDIFFKSINYALENNDIDQQQMNEFMQNYMYVINPEKCAKKSEKWLAKMEKKKGVEKTESGLMYKIVRKGDLKKRATSDSDVVKVNYEGKLMNGFVFDSSYEREQPAEFPLNRVIKGWTEGMKLVGEGGEIILYIPANLAYGQWGNQRGGIGPNQALEFRVELLSVTPAEAPAQAK